MLEVQLRSSAGMSPSYEDDDADVAICGKFLILRQTAFHMWIFERRELTSLWRLLGNEAYDTGRARTLLAPNFLVKSFNVLHRSAQQ